MISIVLVSMVVFAALYLVALPASSQDILLSVGFSLAAIFSTSFLTLPKCFKLVFGDYFAKKIVDYSYSPSPLAHNEVVPPLGFATMADLKKKSSRERMRIATEQSEFWAKYLQEEKLKGLDSGESRNGNGSQSSQASSGPPLNRMSSRGDIILPFQSGDQEEEELAGGTHKSRKVGWLPEKV